MKTNWANVVQKGFKDVGENLMLSQECRHFNGAMAGVVNRYKNEVAAWCDGKISKENGFSTTTQSLWYQHYLNKKRLGRRKIGVHYEHMRPTQYPKQKDQRLPCFSYVHDGKNMICTMTDDVFYKKVWYRDRKVLWTQELRGKEGEYYIMQSRSVKGGYICPNCANPGTLESMIDGCDYCGTKFHLEDFKEKVSSFYLPSTLTGSRNRNPAKLVFIPVLWLGIGLFIINTLPAYGIKTKPFWPVFIVGFLLIVAVMEFFNSTRGSSHSTVTKYKLRSVDPYFSEEYFVGNLTNKLLSIHYAENAGEIRPFATCDLSNQVKNYQNVVECSLVNYLMEDFFTDENWQHLKVSVNLKLIRDVNGRFREEREHLKLHLFRSVSLKASAVSDAVVYTCAGCGASLSLLNGGKCQYCGNELGLYNYDWVIQKYTVK